jgi:hypothetical protein
MAGRSVRRRPKEPERAENSSGVTGSPFLGGSSGQVRHGKGYPRRFGGACRNWSTAVCKASVAAGYGLTMARDMVCRHFWHPRSAFSV